MRSCPALIGVVGQPAALAHCRNGRSDGSAVTADVGIRSTAPVSRVASVKVARGWSVRRDRSMATSAGSSTPTSAGSGGGMRHPSPR